VHGVVYDPRDGVLHTVEADFTAKRRKLASIYELFEE